MIIIPPAPKSGRNRFALATAGLLPALAFAPVFALASRPAGAHEEAAPATRPAGEWPARAVDEVAGLVAVVASPDAGWRERGEAEAALTALPPERVLPALVATFRPPPAGPFYPGAASADADKDAPGDWQAHYAVRRVWDAQTADDKAELGPLLADLLPAARGTPARVLVLRSFERHWSDRAEGPLASLFCDAAEDRAVRRAAAAALLAHRFGRYYNDVRGAADAAGPELKGDLFEVLAARLTLPAPRRADPVLVSMGFGLMERECRKAKDDRGGFDYACLLEALLGETFQPDAADARYAGAAGPDARSRDTVANARKWWAAHGKAVEAEAAKVRPEPA